jgi:hypothetical protein
MDLTVNALAYNAFDRLLYATVPASDGPHGNSLAVIDPATQTVLKFVPVGSDPKWLAISDDGKVLWVVNKGSSTLRRVDLAALTTGPLLPLANLATTLTQGIAILPGTHDSVLVPANGLTIYDNGLPRTMAARTDSLLPVATYSPFLAYAFDGNDTSFAFTSFCLNDHGIFLQKPPIDGFPGVGRRLLFEGGVVYGSGGAYDIGKQTLLGKYPPAAAIAIDSVNRRIFTIQNWLDNGLFVYDMDTFAPLGSDSATGHFYADYPQLVRWGRYGIAFTNNGTGIGPETLYIGESTLVP